MGAVYTRIFAWVLTEFQACKECSMGVQGLVREVEIGSYQIRRTRSSSGPMRSAAASSI